MCGNFYTNFTDLQCTQQSFLKRNNHRSLFFRTCSHRLYAWRGRSGPSFYRCLTSKLAKFQTFFTDHPGCQNTPKSSRKSTKTSKCTIYSLMKLLVVGESISEGPVQSSHRYGFCVLWATCTHRGVTDLMFRSLQPAPLHTSNIPNNQPCSCRNFSSIVERKVRNYHVTLTL